MDTPTFCVFFIVSPRLVVVVVAVRTLVAVFRYYFSVAPKTNTHKKKLIKFYGQTHNHKRKLNNEVKPRAIAIVASKSATRQCETKSEKRVKNETKIKNKSSSWSRHRPQRVRSVRFSRQPIRNKAREKKKDGNTRLLQYGLLLLVSLLRIIIYRWALAHIVHGVRASCNKLCVQYLNWSLNSYSSRLYWVYRCTHSLQMLIAWARP